MGASSAVAVFSNGYHCAVMLHREQYLLALFIDGDAEGSMRSVHFTYGAYISFGLAGRSPSVSTVSLFTA